VSHIEDLTWAKHGLVRSRSLKSGATDRKRLAIVRSRTIVRPFDASIRNRIEWHDHGRRAHENIPISEVPEAKITRL
jgi:hypothetical protein